MDAAEPFNFFDHVHAGVPSGYQLPSSAVSGTIDSHGAEQAVDGELLVCAHT